MSCLVTHLKAGVNESHESHSKLHPSDRAVRCLRHQLAFDDEGQITWEVRSSAQIGLDRFQMCEVLAFVVGCASSEERVAFNAGFERRRFP